MTKIASFSNVSSPPLEQCLETLKQSILLVIHHEQVSGEVRSHIAELVQEILHRAEEIAASSSETCIVAGEVRQHSMGSDPLLRAGQMVIPNQGYSPNSESPDLNGPDQLMGAPRLQTIQVINPVTGKFLTLSQDRVIEWARQQGIDQP